MSEPGSHAIPAITPANALQQFCHSQIMQVAAGLLRQAHPHRGVHEARKGIRRLRSVIALGAPRFGDAADKIDRALQRVGRGLSKLRDAHVAVELARKKAREPIDATQHAVWQRIIEMLVFARSRVLHEAREADADFLRRRQRVAAIAQAISALHWDKLDAATLRAQLVYTEKRAARAARRCDKKPDLQHLHTLRKRLRRRRMQITALATILDPSAAKFTLDGAVTTSAEFRGIVASHVRTLRLIAQKVDEIGAVLDAGLLRLAVRRLPQCQHRSAALALLRPPSGNSGTTNRSQAQDVEQPT
jgi:CHAD domain-containing protein